MGVNTHLLRLSVCGAILILSLDMSFLKMVAFDMETNVRSGINALMKVIVCII
jgi:hypothetical protein